jgi:Zn finger protein HypA/HybF involved in hydrogenase expression
MTEFDFVGSTVICEVCRKEFELEENDLFRCEECLSNQRNGGR